MTCLPFATGPHPMCCACSDLLIPESSVQGQVGAISAIHLPVPYHSFCAKKYMTLTHQIWMTPGTFWTLEEDPGQ